MSEPPSGFHILWGLGVGRPRRFARFGGGEKPIEFRMNDTEFGKAVPCSIIRAVKTLGWNVSRGEEDDPLGRLYDGIRFSGNKEKFVRVPYE